MRVQLDLSPTGSLRPVIAAFAEGLVQVNAVWLQAQLDRGLDPPCCTACAEPPWTTGAGVDYVPHHGRDAKSTTRRFVDGPTMFAEGRATCLDAAAYDAACLRVKKRMLAVVRIDPIDNDNGFHALVELPSGELRDPSMELMSRPLRNTNAVRRRESIIRPAYNIGADVSPMQLVHRASPAGAMGRGTGRRGVLHGNTESSAGVPRFNAITSSCQTCGG